MQKPREYYNIVALLKKEGYARAANNDLYVWSIVDYLNAMPRDYTIFDWLKDTEQNYPNELKGE